MTWKPLQKTPPYFITCYKETEDFYYIGVTNYRRYWINQTSRRSFLAGLKESNDGLEFDDENELVERGLDMLSNPETLKRVSILASDHERLLTISMTKVYEFSLKLELGLLEASAQHFFTAVIQPLLKTVCDLRSSQYELRELLKKKDREIEEYKIEGKAPRRLITTVYDDAAHMKKHTTYEKYFSASEITELLEATANVDNQNNKKTTSKSASTPTAPVKKAEETAAQSTQPENQNIPVHTDSSLPEKVSKVEKSSQNTPIDEITSIVPTQIEETDIPGFVVSTVDLKSVKTESKTPIPRKRPKNQLNY